jgi:hypothetical protein
MSHQGTVTEKAAKFDPIYRHFNSSSWAFRAVQLAGVLEEILLSPNKLLCAMNMEVLLSLLVTQ